MENDHGETQVVRTGTGISPQDGFGGWEGYRGPQAEGFGVHASHCQNAVGQEIAIDAKAFLGSFEQTGFLIFAQYLLCS